MLTGERLKGPGQVALGLFPRGRVVRVFKNVFLFNYLLFIFIFSFIEI